MIVHLPSPLRSYTGGAGQVQAKGATLAEVFDDLERQFPGLRFRVLDEHGRLRPHIKLFVGPETTEDLARPLGADEVLHVVAALSGG